MLSALRFILIATVDFYTDREHGSRSCKVPHAWRRHRPLSSVYALSSFNFCLVGIFLLWFTGKLRTFYLHQYLEGYIWIWQGVISFVCDAVDLGVPSWSHPIDRLSATLFISYNIATHLINIEQISWAVSVFFFTALALSLWTFKLSGDAVLKNEMEGYFFWHTVWHFALPTCYLMYQLFLSCTADFS